MEKDFRQFLKIDHQAMVPKYLQLVDSVLGAIVSRQLRPGDALPSLHDLSVGLEVSKKTAEKSYAKLKEAGIVSSYQGKGHYIKKDNNVMLLEKFSELILT